MPLSVAKGDQVAGLNRGIASMRLYDDGIGQPHARRAWANRARRSSG